MLKSPLDVLSVFPERRTKAQKLAFLDAVCGYVQDLGYACLIEKNMVRIGSENADYVLCARYDTTPFRNDTIAIITLLEILRTLPLLHRQQVCVILQEGSIHPPENCTSFLLENLHLGNEIRLHPAIGLVSDEKFALQLRRCTGWFGKKQIRLMKPSRHKEKQLRVCSVNPKKRFQMKTPAEPDMTTVNILRACISTLISAQ